MSESDPRTPNSVKPWIVAAAVGLVLALVGIFWLSEREPTEELASPDPEPTTTTTAAVAVVPDECDATIPDEVFVPPGDLPATRTDGKVWYGTDELWTAIPANGISDFQKSTWWSSNFPGSAEEPHPEIEVTYRLLGDETETLTNSNVIVASTPDEGSYMSVGFQPDLQGCWEVTATYKDAVLTYVYFSAEGRSPTVAVPDLAGLRVHEAMDLLQESDLFVWTVAVELNLDETVCSQDPEPGVQVKPETSVRIASAGPDGGCIDLNAKVEVPDLVGIEIDEATAALRSADLGGFMVDPTEPGYVVCSQDPQAGNEVTVGDSVILRVFLPGGCEEFLNPNGLYARTYKDEEGREWYGTDCPAADVLISGGPEFVDALPMADDTERERVESLLGDNATDLVQPGLTGLAAIPRIGQVRQSTENGDVVVTDPADDYMVKATIDQTFECPREPFFWNGIPVAFVLVDTN
jgi:hypothetical protein